MQTILVIGGAGYIGSHVVLELSSQGHKVIVLDNLSSGSKKAVLGCQLIEGDMSDRGLLHKIFSKYPITSVVLLAGFIDVAESCDHPSAYYKNNVANILPVLDTMVFYDVFNLIFSSTASICGNAKRPITEDSKELPQNPYSRSKLMTEKIIKDYTSAYGFNYIIFRFFNASGCDPKARIGFHEPFTHLIPIVLSVAKGDRDWIDIYGTDYDTTDGTCIRDYVHVSDLASAHTLGLKYLNKGRKSITLNLGSDTGYSVKEVIESVRKITGKKITVNSMSRRSGDPVIMVANSFRAFSALGWQAKFDSLDKIISDSWNWYKRK